MKLSVHLDNSTTLSLDATTVKDHPIISFYDGDKVISCNARLSLDDIVKTDSNTDLARALDAGAYVTTPPNSTLSYILLPVSPSGMSFRVLPKVIRDLANRLHKAVHISIRSNSGWYRVRSEAVTWNPARSFITITGDGNLALAPIKDKSDLNQPWFPDTIAVYLTPTNHKIV